MSEYVNPQGWPRPSGYSNGIVSEGRYLAISGQIGWNERSELVADDFVAQARQALSNVMAVLRAAGGHAGDLVRLTWYVTDKNEYRAGLRNLGAAYREIVGDHYPAMALLVVADLLEEGAKVEIEATAVLPPGTLPASPAQREDERSL
ncbi:MAG: RidA family protein [Candidatus Eremiobacteraeota bacterium]|nr:RidA family protein [Candidatus Eremiobacteraeota bacterium]